MKTFCKREDGAAAVEFALIAPLLLLLVFGIIYFGFLYGVSHALQHAASEAARASVRGVTSVERLASANSALSEAIQDSPLIKAANLTSNVVETTTPLRGVRVTVTYNLTGTLASILSPSWSAGSTTMVRAAYAAW